MDLPTTRNDERLTYETPKAPVIEKKDRSILEKISFYILIAVVFLTPLAFLPSSNIPIEVVKTAILSIGILIPSVLCLVSLIRRREFSLPKGAMIYASVAVVASIVLSSAFSLNISRSFFGQGFEINTASFLLLMFTASFLILGLFKDKGERIFSIYSAIFASFIILALLHIVRMIWGVDFLTLGFLSSITSSLAGKWYDFALITGLVGFLSLIGIKFLSLGRGMKIVLSILLIGTGLLLFAINFTTLWWIVAVSTLCLGVFEYYKNESDKTGIKGFFSKISFLTVLILVISVVLAWKGNTIAPPIVKAFKFDYVEAVLPWQMTLDIAAGTIKESPILGSGSNSFSNQFLKYKPYAAINPTPFWPMEFNSGFGTLPSFVVTQGLLGLVVWVLFFVFFVKLGIAGLRKATDPFGKFSLVSSFFGSILLWLANLLYSPSHSVLFLTFVMTGIFFASLHREGLLDFRNIGDSSSKKAKKYSFVFSIVILIVLVAWFGVEMKKAVAITYFQSGIKELSANNLASAKLKFEKALFWNTSDAYYRALSETSLLNATRRAVEIQQNAQSSGKSPEAQEVEGVGSMISEAVNYAEKAILIDKYNYYNHLSRARVLETASSLGIPNAYENTKVSYEQAIILNPWNPALYLNLARLEASRGKYDEAQSFIGRALQLKQNYIEAIFLLSQVQVSAGRIKDAIISAQVATQINPNEPLLFFQLGLLHYTDKNYSEAVLALEKAVSLNDQYANARYFLGLSYSRLGKNADAIKQFEELSKTNPDSQEVAFILSNLKSGRSPFTDATPPIDNKPEARKNLPVDENPEKSEE